MKNSYFMQKRRLAGQGWIFQGWKWLSLLYKYKWNR